MGGKATVGESYRFVLPRLGALMWSSILIALVTMLGLLILIVPGVIAMIIYSVTIPVIVLEGLKATKAMSRSKALVKGHKGKVFVVLLVVFLVNTIAVNICSWGIRLLAGDWTSGDWTSMVTAQVFSQGVWILVMPLGSIASLLLYYDLRIRKEPLDLERLAPESGMETGAANEQAPIE